MMSSCYEATITLMDSERVLERTIDCMSRQSRGTTSIVFGEHKILKKLILLESWQFAHHNTSVSL